MSDRTELPHGGMGPKANLILLLNLTIVDDNASALVIIWKHSVVKFK